ncbi:sulfatase family protein [Christiangramia crocea]|uniref:Sulfatase n=1 Tax=Christiangramia crocea TaxID=2904124 RepID=A0A9X1UYB4_9FLAO|nr:sulfatase [Gramella crocea]MCG9972552.1 sulfatase [Gramella crocea]
MILAEDISTDLETYGMPAVKTPVLNELASSGVQFMNAYGNNSICSPSRSNMMTGVHQNIINAQHHRSNREIPLEKPYQPITTYLRDAGYTCIIGNRIAKGMGKKIDVNFKHSTLGEWNGETEFGLFDKTNGFNVEDQPFFNQVTLKVTHRGDWWDEVRANSKHKVDPDNVVLPPYYADTPEVRLDWAKYLDQIEYMDHEVGLLLDDLEKKGMRDNTIVIFIGDNGRCNIRGKGYLYEPGLHLPLIVNWPAGLTGGKKDDRLVASVDVAATILEAAGVELPSYMTARSVIEEDENPREYIYSARDLWDEILEESRAITTHNFRYIKNNVTDRSYDAHQAYLEFYRPAVHVMRELDKKGELTKLQGKFFEDSKEPEELYDIVNDPYEQNNLINDPAYKQVVEKMRAYYKDWNAKYHDHGFDPIDWKNCQSPRAVEVIEWVKEERPEILEQMKKGIEPGFGKLLKEYKQQSE